MQHIKNAVLQSVIHKIERAIPMLHSVPTKNTYIDLTIAFSRLTLDELKAMSLEELQDLEGYIDRVLAIQTEVKCLKIAQKNLLDVRAGKEVTYGLR